MTARVISELYYKLHYNQHLERGIGIALRNRVRVITIVITIVDYAKKSEFKPPFRSYCLTRKNQN